MNAGLKARYVTYFPDLTYSRFVMVRVSRPVDQFVIGMIVNTSLLSAVKTLYANAIGLEALSASGTWKML